jgi:hypothetical protein
MHKGVFAESQKQSLSRNRLSPRYINIAITPIQQFEHRKMLGQQQKHAQKEKKWKQWRSDKTMMTRNRCAPRLLPHAPSTPKHPVPSNTFKKGDAVDAALLPGPDRS